MKCGSWTSYWPRRTRQSCQFSAAARSWTTTQPEGATGSRCSAKRSTSGPPKASRTTACTSGPWEAEDALGDDVALDERRAAGDRRAARLVGEAQPAPGVAVLGVGVEGAGEAVLRDREVGHVLQQRGRHELAERRRRHRGAGGHRVQRPQAVEPVHAG